MRFVENLSAVDPGVYISMTTRARDFKFAGTLVQKVQLAMVALTQNFFFRALCSWRVTYYIKTHSSLRLQSWFGDSVQ